MHTPTTKERLMKWLAEWLTERNETRVRRPASRRSGVALALALLAVILVAACAPAPLDDTVNTQDIRVELVEWARLAHNAHNVQPWRVVLDSEDASQMALFVDSDRLLPATDPLSRQIVISMGTFLAVLDARAAQLGYSADIDLFPEGQFSDTVLDDRPVATITVRSAEGVSSDALYPIAAEPDALTSPTIKYRFQPATLTAGTIETIEGYSTPTIDIAVINDQDEVAFLNGLSIESFEREMSVERTMLESYDLMRMNGRERRETPYGLSLAASFPVRSLWAIDAIQTLFPQNPEAFAESGVRLFADAMEEITHYVILTSEENDRTTQVETGMILQAIWMELHNADHVVLPNSQALQEYPEMADLYDRMHRRYAADGRTVQMLLAVAQPQPGRHRFGPRLPTERLIVDGR